MIHKQQNMTDFNKPIFSLTVEEFISALREGLGVSDEGSSEKENLSQTDVKKHYVYGLKGLSSLLGCSLSTAGRIKRSGSIDSAVYQRGKVILFDSDLILDLLSVQRKKTYGNRKGYRK